MQDDERSLLREFTRQHLRFLWESRNFDVAALSDDDRGVLEAMRQHPEYADLWARLDEVTDEELERDGSNPVIHITIHQTVENQLAANNPPVVTETLERLLKQGQTRHEAVHQIGAIVVEEMHTILTSGKPFDEERYTAKLRRLAKSSPRRRRRKKS